jgi:O-antigen/teichoic acid export membrane protein
MTSANPVAKLLRSHEIQTLLSTGFLLLSATLFAFLSTRWLSPHDRGVIVVVLTTSSLLMLVGSMGVPTVGRRLVANPDEMTTATYVRVARRMSGAHIVTTMTLGLGTLALSGGLDGVAAALAFTLFAVISFYGYMCRELLHGLGRHRSAVWVEVVPALGMLLWILPSGLRGSLSLTTTLVAVVAGGLAQLAFVQFATRGLTSGAVADINWRSLLRDSLPALGFSLGSALVVRSDRLILGGMVGAAAVGAYGLAATFSELLWVIPMTLSQFAFRRASVSPQRALTSRMWLVTLAITASLAALVAWVGALLIPVLFGQAYEPAVGLLPWLCLAAVPMGSYYFDSALLNGTGAFSTVSRITAVGVVVMLVSGPVLIWFFGGLGAAWASLCAYAVMGIGARRAVEVARRSVAVTPSSTEGRSDAASPSNDGR